MIGWPGNGVGLGRRLAVAGMAGAWALAAVAAGVEPRLVERMYSSRRASACGDLLTVHVVEQTSASKSQSLNTKKEMSAATTNTTIGASATALADHSYRNLPNTRGVQLLPYNLGAAAEYAGSGATASSETLQADFTVQVTDVLPNSVLVIKGERLVVRNREKMNMVLTGLVRQQDVRADNSVLSSQIAEATIRYESRGSVSSGTMPGWLTRAFQYVNPF